MTATIEVAQTGDGDPLTFNVRVSEGAGETHHAVTMTRHLRDRLCGGKSAPACVEAVFRFLLDREPKEAIMQRFDVSVVARYFPEFEDRLPDYLPG